MSPCVDRSLRFPAIQLELKKAAFQWCENQKHVISSRQVLQYIHSYVHSFFELSLQHLLCANDMSWVLYDFSI